MLEPNLTLATALSGTAPPTLPMENLAKELYVQSRGSSSRGLREVIFNRVGREVAVHLDEIRDHLPREMDFPYILARTPLSDPVMVEHALGRLAHLLEYTGVESSRSSYVNWLCRLGLESIIKFKEPQVLDQFLRRVHLGGPLKAMEYFLRPYLHPAELPHWPIKIPQKFRGPSPHYRSIKKSII